MSLEQPAADVVARVLGVTHRYGKTLALAGVELELPAARMIGFSLYSEFHQMW